MSQQQSIPFAKYQGLGNDFIIVDVRDDAARKQQATAAAGHLCDRHFGIGGDGVLIVEQGDDHAVAMRVVNADGSRPQMCGNGLRCVVQWLVDKGEFTADAPFFIDTDAGPHRITVHDALIEVQMQTPAFAGVAASGPMLTRPLTALDRTFTASAVSMGNPHVILFDTPPEPEIVAKYGAALCSHAEFPEQANVSFSAPDGEGLRVTVHERGAGVTLACGTGACAAVAAYVHAGRLPANRFIPVALPGGTLMINIPRTDAGEFGRVLMRGPAQSVFAGHVSVAG